MPPDPRASWRNPRILVVICLVFSCGALAGALTMRFGIDPKVQQPAVYWTKGGRQISLQHFERELGLTPEQSREMAMVLDDFMQYYHSLQAQMEGVRASGKDRILRILDQSQQRKFEKMLSEIPLREIH